MAYTRKNGRPHYELRQSFKEGNTFSFRHVMDIGSDPGSFIRYSGKNAFFFTEHLEDTIRASGAEYDADLLEDIFWPWVMPDVRRAVETFRSRSSRKSKRLSRQEKETIANSVHYLDKRRRHWLKFGSMDQGPLEKIPVVLFRDLPEKSRDEIEQEFMRREYSLKPGELKTYVYTVFDIQRHFQSFMAKRMPQVLDQAKVDAHFIESLCKANHELFKKDSRLNEYMIRYAVMFFDHTYADSTLLDDFARAFMFGTRHRKSPGPPPPRFNETQALKIFNLTRREFKTMDRKTLTRHYKKLARHYHPDAGGSHDKFIRLGNAYQSLLVKLSEK